MRAAHRDLNAECEQWHVICREQRERITELEAQLRLIVRHHDMRAEIYSGEGRDAALAWMMANLARDVLGDEPST